MKHPPVTHGLEQATLVSSEAWEEFFGLCLEMAAVARARRAARAGAERQGGRDGPAAGRPQETPVPEPEAAR